MEKDTVVMSVRLPVALRDQIEEFTEVSGLERPSQAIRVLVELGLQASSGGAVSLERLSSIQHNATSEAIAVVYGILSQVVNQLVASRK